MRARIALVILAVALCGCKGLRLGPYTSPAVTGRVVAADSRQPLAGVDIERDGSFRSRDIGSPPKGAEFLLQNYTTQTDRDGKFFLRSERALTIFRPSGWASLQLSFHRAGYERFETNYSILTATTNSPRGEPILETGDIALRPVGKSGHSLAP